MADPTFSVVAPVCRQGQVVEPILSEYVRCLARLGEPFELLPIVDAHDSGTTAVCDALCGRESRIRVLKIDGDSWGRAVQMGLSAAQGGHLCYANVAYTSGEDLASVLRYSLAYPDCIIKANRRIRDGLVRRLGSLLYVIECRSFFDLAYWDINGTPKVFPRTRDRLLRLKSQDDLVDLEFEVTCRREGYPVLEVPLPTVERAEGRSSVSLLSSWRMYRGAYRLWRNQDLVWDRTKGQG